MIFPKITLVLLMNYIYVFTKSLLYNLTIVEIEILLALSILLTLWKPILIFWHNFTLSGSLCVIEYLRWLPANWSFSNRVSVNNIIPIPNFKVIFQFHKLNSFFDITFSNPVFLYRGLDMREVRYISSNVQHYIKGIYVDMSIHCHNLKVSQWVQYC